MCTHKLGLCTDALMWCLFINRSYGVSTFSGQHRMKRNTPSNLFLLRIKYPWDNKKLCAHTGVTSECIKFKMIPNLGKGLEEFVR